MENTTESKEFLVTARKWRPLRFMDVVGQQHISITLQNAVKSGRIHHAYLFSGPRGVGKTTTARILARSINCTNPIDHEPCNECESCKAIIDGRSLDVIEIDGASNNSVDDIRKLRENSRYLPANGKYKMYIIDEVHMLSTSAFNALLKTLEEPPPHLLFVFATTEPHKVLPTILSRCQRFEFKRMEIDDIVAQLKLISQKEGINIDETCLITIAKKGDGSMRDSQSIYDQVIAFCGNNVDYSKMADALHLVDQEFFFRITKDIINKNLTDIFVLTKEILLKGYDLQECIEGLLEHLRNVLAVKVTDRTDLLETSKDMLIRYKEEASRFSQPDLLRLLTIASTTDHALRYAPQPRIKFEMALIQMASLDNTLEINELLSGLQALKKNSNLSLGTFPTANNIVINKPAQEQQVIIEEKPTAKQNIVSEVPAQISVSSVKNIKYTDANTLKNNWQNFIDKYANSGTGLSSLKQNNEFIVKFFDTEIIIYSKNSFITENLNSKKRELSEYLELFFGSSIRYKILTYSQNPSVKEDEEIQIIDELSVDDDEIEEIIDDEIISPVDIIILNKQKEIDSSNVIEQSEIQEIDLSPLEDKLVKLFGATVIM
jgi:DNA polymerase III subunit gamma/tau